MNRLLTALLLLSYSSSFGAAPPRGGDRLRELVIFPLIDIKGGYGFSDGLYTCNITESKDVSEEIVQLRKELNLHTNDVETLWKLGDRLDSIGSTNDAKSFYEQAERLCRKKVAANPHNGIALTELGSVLLSQNKDTEAENVLRQATMVSSNAWQCWVGFGKFCNAESHESLLVNFLHSHSEPKDGLSTSQELLDYKPTPNVLKTSEGWCKKAADCYDKAAVLAPKEPNVFLARANYEMDANYYNYLRRYYRSGERVTPAGSIPPVFSPEVISDLEQAAQLSVKDYAAIGFAAHMSFLANGPNSAASGESGRVTLDMLPMECQGFIRNSMTRLQNLSDDSDKRAAAGALQALALIKVPLDDHQGAIADLRRSISLDPTQALSWDILFGLTVTSGSPEELLSVSESRLKADDSAKSHLILAKVQAKRGNWNEATSHTMIAGKMDTNDIIAPLLLAAIALKQSTNTNQLDVACKQLARASEILERMPDNEERQKRDRELVLNTAIANGLYGSEGNLKVAKHLVEILLAVYPDDEDAHKIGGALGGN